ncbi:MAG: iron-sulfur cluster assembly accessory protein [Gammaproteobacteria bacterium]|nr:iron-sulfur cluster assembly accessory protein [Gammaproteobacteria bacterium]
MITISKSAARQINFSAQDSGINHAVMRIAVRKLQDGSFHYALGFDDAFSKHDIQFKSEGIDLVVSPQSLDHVRELTIDYVELDSGENNFVFINPADPNCNLTSFVVDQSNVD